MPGNFCTKCRSFVWHNTVQMYCFVLYLFDKCQIGGNANFRTNFTAKQKVDFIIKAIEQQVPPLL